MSIFRNANGKINQDQDPDDQEELIGFYSRHANVMDDIYRTARMEGLRDPVLVLGKAEIQPPFNIPPYIVPFDREEGIADFLEMMPGISVDLKTKAGIPGLYSIVIFIMDDEGASAMVIDRPIPVDLVEDPSHE